MYGYPRFPGVIMKLGGKSSPMALGHSLDSLAVLSMDHHANLIA
jgi:hypothetical protein